MHIQTLNAIFYKQIKDVFKNTQVLILFFIYPLIAFVMTSAMSSQMGNNTFFVSVFGTMHCIFTPIVTTAAIISEEKEKNTLRVLIMSNVSSLEYLLSIGGFVLLCTLITGSSFIGIGNYNVTEAFVFLGSMCVGSILSIILGMAIGAYCKNMMGANGIAVPIGMLFAFMPMLAAFSSGIEKVSRFTYGQQISNLIADTREISLKGIGIIIANLIVFAVAFVIVFKKNKLDV